MDDLFSVKDTILLVTGGSRGIGKMIARSFVERGATVIISSRKIDACEEVAAQLSAVGRCDALPADLSQMAEIERLSQTIMERYGRLDVLVNNAGATWGAPLGGFPESGWDKTMDINLRAPFFLTQKLLPALKVASPEARIINIASIDGLSPPSFDSFAYSASKAGLIMLTRHLAKQLGAEGITVNAVAPGLFRTDMTAGLIDQAQGDFINANPLGRIGEPDDIGGLCLFLASKAAAFVNGATIPCDGGLQSCGR